MNKEDMMISMSAVKAKLKGHCPCAFIQARSTQERATVQRRTDRSAVRNAGHVKMLA
ncbi:hypothetical protein KIN20_030126 [Parelaphostrongylus tenuis]|uniref:Uncharacterized protein n=1 Tax=Parelaphostrongylus tenuis TaxID=148309 RepID=A0AAD5R3B4_PARTN|nr:hypothetical protein KIN20_030126 [Parelaphostrongylus tenuis]